MRERETVAILDFGSQYNQLIARRVRECKVYCELLPFNTPLAQISGRGLRAIILSGGPQSVTSPRAPRCDSRIFELGVPVLGICYGMQLMAQMLGGEVSKVREREFGLAHLTVLREDSLFHNLRGEKPLQVWMSHGDSVTSLPPGFRVLARTSNTPVAAMGDSKRELFGVQFHPEVVHTPRGKAIFKNFLFRIAGCSPQWTMDSFVRQAIEEIRERVGEEKVLCALSGGVDSSTLSVLLHKAIGERLVAVFVDNGLLRKGEPEEVVRIFRNTYQINLKFVEARKRFLEKLKGVVDPEEKRRIIGHEFVQIFEEEAKKEGKIRFLAQGTLYPDVIESRSSFGGPSSTIKTHHNVGGLPKDLKFELIEPFRNLFKDEVRKVGRVLKLPPQIISRQPVPGPGLAVRIIGEVTEERLKILQESDAIVREEVGRSRWEEKVWQAFAVLLPIKTVGVMGDERTYEHVVSLRVVTSTDGMTADWAKLPHLLLGRISNRIINEVKGVNRVVYDISSKPPSTIEWE